MLCFSFFPLPLPVPLPFECPMPNAQCPMRSCKLSKCQPPENETEPQRNAMQCPSPCRARFPQHYHSHQKRSVLTTVRNVEKTPLSLSLMAVPSRVVVPLNPRNAIAMSMSISNATPTETRRRWSTSESSQKNLAESTTVQQSAGSIAVKGRLFSSCFMLMPCVSCQSPCK
jgi:hypothetical protein